MRDTTRKAQTILFIITAAVLITLMLPRQVKTITQPVEVKAEQEIVTLAESEPVDCTTIDDWEEIAKNVHEEYIPSAQAAEGYISELRLIEITEEIGNQYNICPELLQAIAYKESSLYINATNGSCKGLMQVSSTYMGERMERLGVEDIYDEYGNILLAADLIAELRDTTEHGDDIYYVLMRYNMRTDTANKLYKAGTITEYAISVVEHARELERIHGK